MGSSLLTGIIVTAIGPPAIAQREAPGPSWPLFGTPPDLEPNISRRALPPREIRPHLESHPWWAVIETTAAFALNVVWYWYDAKFNTTDWDLAFNASSWKAKAVTFEAVRFDSNRFRTNAGSHTTGGTVIYLIGRGNNLGMGASTLLAAGEIVVWEYIGEFYEKPSVNDLINNPIGGLAVGEAFFQLSQFFARGARNGVNQVLAAVFSPISALNGYQQQTPPALDRDGLGFPADVRHRFDVYGGVSSTRFGDDAGHAATRAESVLGVRTLLNTVPGYGRPTGRSGAFGPGRLTQIDAAIGLDATGTAGSLFATQVSLVGYHGHNLQAAEDRTVRGQELMLSLFNSFDYSIRRRPGMTLDRIASFGLLAPTLDLSQRAGEAEATLHLETTPMLAFVSSLAFDRFRTRSGTDGLKSALAAHGYYYAYGLSLGGQIAARYRDLSGGFALRWQRFASIEGLDRFQEQLTRDYHLVDGRTQSALWLSYRPRRGDAEIRMSLETVGRFGTLSDIHVTTGEQRGLLTLGFVL